MDVLKVWTPPADKRGVSWQVAAAANAVIATCYFGIVWLVLSGLLRTGQLRTNPLGAATALIFLTCAVHHGSHSVHLLLPLVAEDQHGLAMRQAFGPGMAAWDVLGAAVGVLYLSLRSSFGQLLQTPEMFRDLAHARVEEAIAAEHEALVEAQELGRMGSFRRSMDGTWTTSEEYARLLELEPGQDPSEAWGRVLADDLERVRALVDGARTGVAGDGDYRLVRRDGSTLHLHLRVRAERDAAGAVIAVEGTVQDITERTELEAAMLAAEQRFRVAFDGSPIGVALTSTRDADRGLLLSTNPALAEMLGWPADDLIAQPLTALAHECDRQALEDLLAVIRVGGERAELELRLMQRDGHPVWVMLSAAKLPGPEEMAVVNVMDVSQRKQFEGQLQQLADHDALTGLFNRRRFTAELDRALLHTERYGDAGAVLFLDLDGFKFVNDSLGHAAGDELIARVGGMFASAVRATDVVARVGGDEFAVILTRADEEAAMRVAQNLLDTIRQGAIIVSEQRHAQVSTSIGIALYTQGDDRTADELLVEADIAMYDAKEAGKDRYAIFREEAGDHRRMSVRENWNRRLRDAIDQRLFQLHAQPITPFGPMDVPTFELLLRLPDEHGDLIPPGAFLYNAERFDLITRIDQWVIGEAVGLLRASHDAGRDLRLTVNVSGRTMTDPHFGPHVAALIAERPLRPGRLVIEITETAAITNIERARTLARELRGLGCEIALDDFGAGFASFYYLKHLQVDYLKIDGEFIRNLCRTPTDQLVVKAVVDIARGMGTRTIAEFVGDDATVARLTELGVDFGQGYHLGHPGALAERLPHLLAGSAPIGGSEAALGLPEQS